MKTGLINKRAAWILAVLLVLAVPAAALADTTAAVDKPSVQEGDTVELTVTVTGKSMAVAEGVFLYDSSLLTFTEASGGAGDGFLSLLSAQNGGSDSMTARVVFTAAKAGEAKIDVNIERILDYAGNEAEGASASANVTVTAAPVSAELTPVPVDYSKEGVAAENVQGASGAMYIWRSIENVTIPSRYTETELIYKEQTVKGAAIQDSNAPVLLYLSEANGDNAGYYVYDEARDILYPYQTVSSVSRSYILLQPDGSVPVPEGYTEATVVIDEKEYAAWKSEDAAGDVYLIYARNPDGDVGFYSYSPEDGAIQRYAVIRARPVQPMATPVPTPAPAPEMPADEETPAVTPAADEMLLPKIAFYALLGGIGLLVVILIFVLVSHAQEKKRRRERAAQRRAAKAAAERQNTQGM